MMNLVHAVFAMKKKAIFHLDVHFAIDRQIQEKVNEILQIKLMKLKIQKF